MRGLRRAEIEHARTNTAALRTAEPYWMRAQKDVAKRIGADRLEALIATLHDLEALHPGAAAAKSRAEHR